MSVQFLLNIHSKTYDTPRSNYLRYIKIESCKLQDAVVSLVWRVFLLGPCTNYRQNRETTASCWNSRMMLQAETGWNPFFVSTSISYCQLDRLHLSSREIPPILNLHRTSSSIIIGVSSLPSPITSERSKIHDVRVSHPVVGNHHQQQYY